MNTTSIITHLDRALSPLGFRRHKATWNRENGLFVDVLDIQISKAKSTVTLNIGVMERSVYAICWGRESDPFVEEPFCTVRTRIGELLEGKDKWWELQNVDDTAEEMSLCITTQIIPFFERMHSMQEMCSWLVANGAPSPKNPLPAICLAALQHRLGEQIEACSVLAGCQKRAPGA